MSSSVPPDVPPVPPPPPPQTPPPYYPPPQGGGFPAYGGPPPEPPTTEARIPWEQPGAPMASAFVETLRLILLEPARAFRRVSLAAPLWRPLLFGTLCSYIGIAFQAIYEFFWRSAAPDMMPAFMQETGLDPMISLLGTLVASPLLLPVGFVVAALIWHVLLSLFGASSAGYKGTLRAVAYGSAPGILAVVPLCGTVVGALWQLVATVIGLAVVHRAPMGRVIAAAALLIIVCCLCCVVPLLFAFREMWKATF